MSTKTQTAITIVAFVAGLAGVLGAYHLGHESGVESIARSCALDNGFKDRGVEFTCDTVDLASFYGY